MTASIAYPLPLDAWDTFKPFVERWVGTYRKHPAGYPHKIIAAYSGPPPGSDVRLLFDGLPVEFLDYNGGGIDIGAAQFAARREDTDFIVGMTSRVYFHRAGWLSRIIGARNEFGRGLYGASGSYERSQSKRLAHVFPNPHVRGVLYGVDASDFRAFPYTVTDRATAFQFESGEWNFMEWFRDRGLMVKMVTWSGVYDPPLWRDPSLKNIFRRGDQSDLLVFDKHSDFYSAADNKTKRQLEAWAGDGLRAGNSPVNHAYLPKGKTAL
jgi:hypothetical protein